MAGSSTDRIVVLIDMDCFFCQVETKLHPEFAGKPLAVVQYNQWQLGGIIAVNYEARDYGVTRHMRGEEAKEKCPDLVLASVPCLRGKADTSRYRSAGREVIDVIRKHCTVVQRASVDEAYLDITDIVDKRISSDPMNLSELVRSLSNTFVVGYSEVGVNNEDHRHRGLETWITNIFEDLEDVQAQRLAIAGIIVEELRADIFEKTGFRCSAGIAQNKILAKLACGLHKPNRQTILPPAGVAELYSTLPVKKVRNLGGKFGDVVVESLSCNVMGDLLRYPLQYLQKRFDEKTGLWLFNIARGIDNEPVTTQLVSKSIGACKKFPGKQAIVSLDVLKHWAGELAAEVCERLEQDLEENERRATLLTICYHYYQNKTTVSQSRSCTLNSYKPDKMTSRCVDIIRKSTQCPIAYLGISASKFIPAKGSGNFVNFFKSNKPEVGQKMILLEDKKPDLVVTSTTAKQTEANHAGRENKTNNSTCITTSNNKLSEVTEINDNDIETHSDDLRNYEVCEQVNKKIIDTPNTRMNESPTSRKVTNLVKYMNDRNKADSLHKNVTSKNILNESLNQDKFKGSFFMNILNERGQEILGQKTEIKDVEKFNGGENSKNLYVQNSDETETKHNFVNRDCYSVEEPIVNINIEEYEDTALRVACYDVNEKSNNKTVSVQSSSVRLQEIFPDLNNIDPNIVSLLPLDLQEEAKLYIKVQNKDSNRTTGNSIKNPKTKNKSKTNSLKEKEGNSMYTFLIKANSSSSNDVPSKRCTQCHQLIPLTKYEEHNDFHIAENLQRELNAPLINNTGVKRKINTNTDMTSAKRRTNIDISKSNKNCNSIRTFFS